MKPEMKANLLIICILEISLGLLALVEIVKVFGFQTTSFASVQDIRWVVPAVFACFIYFILGLVILNKTALVRLLHYICIPCICVVIIISAIMSGMNSLYDIAAAALPVVSGIIAVGYIVQNKNTVS